ncbi:MAG: elongation factor G [Acidimicrobiales bacterium]
MANLSPSSIHNVCLVGHHGAGKTALAEALLAVTGTIPRLGSVEKGTTVCDFEPEETQRQLSVSLSIAPFELDGIKVNVLDVPGYADFSAELAIAMAVTDLAVVVVSATDGVQGQTLEAWRAAAAAGLPRMIVISKLDRERADYERVLAEIRGAFGAGVAPVELPIGTETAFRGVIDLLDDTATVYDTTGAPPVRGDEGPIPDELVNEEHEVHEQLVEGIVVADDDLTTRYLDGETIERTELQDALALGIASASVYPVLCASAISGVGVDRLAKLLVELAPPADHRYPLGVVAGDTMSDIACDPAGPPLLTVCKTLSDQHAGRISLCKVVSGTIRPDLVLVNTRTRSEERLHVLEQLRGHATSPMPEAVAGDFVAVPRLTGTRTGDTLAPKGSPVSFPLPEPDPPALQAAVKPSSRADEDKLMSSLHRLAEEDPSISVTRVDETHQTVLGTAGEVHLSITLERLTRKYGVHVEREEVIVAYRETITHPCEAEGRYKKQTGGHGQFGVVHLRLEPLARGEGFQFRDEVVGGAIPRQYIPAVEKGVLEAMDQGGQFGFPVVDVAVTCDDGKYHSVDSSEMSFKMAGALAFRTALDKAGAVVLEPVSQLQVTVPAEAQGDVLGDLHSKRGRVQGTDSTEGMQVITALVPTAELSRYAVDLRAITGGRGRFRLTHDHYDVKP